MQANFNLFDGQTVIAIVATEAHGAQFVDVAHWGVGVLHSIGSQYNHLTSDYTNVAAVDLESDEAVSRLLFEPVYRDWRVVELNGLMPTSRGIVEAAAADEARRVIRAAIAHRAQNPRPAAMAIV